MPEVSCGEINCSRSKPRTKNKLPNCGFNQVVLLCVPSNNSWKCSFVSHRDKQVSMTFLYVPNNLSVSKFPTALPQITKQTKPQPPYLGYLTKATPRSRTLIPLTPVLILFTLPAPLVRFWCPANAYVPANVVVPSCGSEPVNCG